MSQENLGLENMVKITWQIQSMKHENAALRARVRAGGLSGGGDD